MQGPDERVLASDIRALRRARGLTLAEIALKLGRSVGWVSQVERGLSTPSLSDLRAFAELFGVPISLFFSHDVPVESERGVVVRAGRRRTLGTSETGLVEELLSPDLGGSFEMVRSIFAAGAEMKTEQLRPTEEAGYIASGIFEIEIAGIWHRLGEGDSFRFEGKPYRWRNPGTEPGGCHLGGFTTGILKCMSPKSVQRFWDNDMHQNKKWKRDAFRFGRRTWRVCRARRAW